jgi:hypothetical protein
MRTIVVLLLILATALNAASTAEAADRCLRFGTQPRPAQALVVARPGVDLRAAVMRGAQDGTGAIVVRPAQSSCARTYWVGDGRLWVSDLRGTIRSDSTRVDGLVAAADIADAVRGSDVLHAGGSADVEALRARIDRVHDSRVAAEIVLVAIMAAFVLVAPRRALMAGPAAITAVLLLAAVGSTSVVFFALLAVLGAFAPLRSLWVFFAAYLVVLVVSPETQSLALLGPHVEGGGRFYGISNDLETLLLAAALLLGLAAAPLVFVVVAWSRAGADGGGALVFLSSYAWLWLAPRARRKAAVAVAVAGVAAAAIAFVAVDAATGGSSHVTRTVGDGPGALWDELVHRWSVSWHGAVGTTSRALLDVVLLAVLVWVAVQRPRTRVLDAFLVGIAVSLVVNDTPQDVLLWGSLQAVALRRARID